MTELMHDATQRLSAATKEDYNRNALADIFYADGTLLLGVSDAHLNVYLHAVSWAGSLYGMELHWG